MHKEKVVILGSGAMGTACASVLVNNNHDVFIYGINKEELSDLENGYNQKYFGNKFIAKFKTSTNLRESLAFANYIIIAIPTKFIPDVFYDVVKLINNKAIIINLSKGFWPNSSSFIHTKMIEVASSNKNITAIVSLIGPSFAVDIINKNITIINAVSSNLDAANKVKKLFSNEWFGVSVIDDVIGAEIGSVFKNILAIGSGLLAGMGYSINSQASFLTFGLKEIKQYSIHLNAKVETVYELCSLGDLMLTALSEKSRNYMYGKNFFDNKIDDKLVTVEGLYALKHVYNQIKNDPKKIRLPLIEGIYKIIYNKDNPNEIIRDLIRQI